MTNILFHFYFGMLDFFRFIFLIAHLLYHTNIHYTLLISNYIPHMHNSSTIFYEFHFTFIYTYITYIPHLYTIYYIHLQLYIE